MPRVSVGAGPARISSGCCVAFAIPLLIVVIVLIFSGCGSSSSGPGTSSWALAGLEKKGENSSEAHCVVSQIEEKMPKTVISWAFEAVVDGANARLPEHQEGNQIQIEELQEIGRDCVK
jgi:hypothetical protein